MKIVFHGGNAANFREGFEDILGEDHEIITLPDRIESAGDQAAFAAADVIIGVKLSKDDPQPCALRLYQAPAAGTDAIDETCLPPSAVLCNAFGHEHAIAEYVMAVLLTRHVPLARADERLRAGHWDFWAGRPGALRTELGAQSIGLLGFGHIGKAIAMRAKAFGMEIIYSGRRQADPAIEAELGAKYVSFDELLETADVVSLHCPLNDETKHLINADRLKQMREDAYLVNTTRGPVVDEQALVDALRKGEIKGAGLDVFEEEPKINPGLLDLENAVLIPHLGSATIETRTEMGLLAAANTVAILNGEEPPSPVVRVS